MLRKGACRVVVHRADVYSDGVKPTILTRQPLSSRDVHDDV